MDQTIKQMMHVQHDVGMCTNYTIAKGWLGLIKQSN